MIDFAVTLRTTGVTSPPSVETATEISTDPCLMSTLSPQVTLASGTSMNAAATALTTRSLTETRTGETELICSRIASRASTLHSVVR
ncbi:unannotated protein [freshwater metagenome]|uniref:Unannotated protein n=1 Tax=freshwater metagenome TaxID=449393 RepID=A0A6J6EIU4_9ZZZZ